MTMESLTPPTKKYHCYVTATDKFMSGWGHAKNKTNKLVFCCNSRQQAFTVKDNLEARDEMKYINICFSKPRYSSRNYLVQWFVPNGEYKEFYEEGYFRRRR